MFLCTLIEIFPALIEKSPEIQSKIKTIFCFCIYMETSWRNWSMNSKETFSRDTDHKLSCRLAPVQDFLTVKHIKFICNWFEQRYKILTHM